MHRQTNTALRMALAALLLAGAAAAQSAAFVVGPLGGSFNGTVDLKGDDLVVNGPLNAAGASFAGVGSVWIAPSGSIDATNAFVALSTGWHNAAGPAAFTGPGSTVAVVGGGITAFTGSTTFNNLSAEQAGQTLNIAAGSTQQVAGTLTLGSVTLHGQGGTAFLTLLPGGAQQIGAVSVADVDASGGQRLAPIGHNASPGSSAPGWFSLPPTADTVAVPTLSTWGLLLLAALLGAARARTARSAGLKTRP